VRTIQYALDFANVSRPLNDQYRAKGMSLITTQRRGAYREILTHLATRIVELAANPLPPLVPPPDIRTLRNAFWDPPEVAAADDAAPDLRGGDAVALSNAVDLNLGPRQLAVFEVHAEQRAGMGALSGRAKSPRAGGGDRAVAPAHVEVPDLRPEHC
jgi:hypothetical protein